MAVTSTHQQYSMGHSLWEVMLRFASDLISVMITAWKTKNHLKLLFHVLIVMLMSTSFWVLSPSGTMTVSVLVLFLPSSSHLSDFLLLFQMHYSMLRMPPTMLKRMMDQ